MRLGSSSQPIVPQLSKLEGKLILFVNMHLIILTTNRRIELTTFTDLSTSVAILKVLPHSAIGIEKCVKKLF